VTYGGSEFPAKYTLSGWQLNSSNVIRTVSATETEILVDRPYVIEAQWSADYTPMWVLIFIVVSSAAVIVAIVVVVIKRPGSFGRLSSLFKSNLRRRKLRSADSGLAATAVVVCEKCGGKIPSSAEYCQSCGAVRTRGLAAGRPDTDASDERVYDYVVKRRGEISLSRASKDLGLSVDDVKRSTERLKKKGRLA
jgi:ribosomal protein L32